MAWCQEARGSYLESRAHGGLEERGGHWKWLKALRLKLKKILPPAKPYLLSLPEQHH